MCTLETNRLILRKFSKEDWLDLYEYLSQEEVVKYEPYGVLSKEECQKIAIGRSKNEAFLAVCLKESNKVIGNLYFQPTGPNEFLTWEIGYVFNSTYHKKGYATEACQRLLKHAFEQLNAHRIIARCNPDNVPSWKLLERLSMQREGHFRKPAFFKRTDDGLPIWHDAFQYSILEEDRIVQD